MGQNPNKSSSEGLDKKRFDEAAQTLRNTLAFATIEAKIPASSITVQSLHHNLTPLSPLSTTPINQASPFASPGLSSTDFNVGLGLKMDDNPNTFSAELAVNVKKQEPILPLQSSPKEPSLYAAIFGSAYNSVTSRKHSTPPKIASRPTQAKSLSPHVRQGSSARLEKVASSPRLSQSPNWRQDRPLHKVSNNNRNLDSFTFARPVASSPTKPLHRESIGLGLETAFPVTPGRSRMRSAGGSLLPNGHPASSLAQNLGIASGSTPRSRNASRDRSLMYQFGQRDTDTPSRSSLIFADSSFRTPQKTGRRSMQAEGNEAAAHMLLDLAKSPSPRHNRHLDRFDGTSTRLDNLLEDNDEVGHKSPSSSGKVMELYESKMGSPPMTPPQSTRQQKIAFGGLDSEDSSPCPEPTITSTRKGSIVLLSDLEQQRIENNNSSSSRHLSEPLQGSNYYDQASITSETPRTPPPLSAPSTPKAPGSNFCYGDFLHVSPSPQPRMRINSNSGTPRISSILDTPTKGTKSHARFLSYGSLINVDEEPANLTVLEMPDILTPGKLTSGKHILESSPLIGSNGNSKKAKLNS